MRLLPFLAALPAPAFALLEFVNPPKAGPVGDLRGSPTYEVGTVLDVIWTGNTPGQVISITLWQLDPVTAEWFGSLEYVIQKTVDIQSYSWVVGTRKNLSDSNLFFMSIFEDGKTTGDSNSHYFYIVKPGQTGANETQATSTSVTLSTSTLASTTSATEPTSSPSKDNATGTGNAPSNPTDASDDASDDASSEAATTTTSDGLTTTAKVAIGVSVPCAVLLGAVAMYLWLNHQRKRDREALAATTAAAAAGSSGGPGSSTYPHSEGYAPVSQWAPPAPSPWTTAAAPVAPPAGYWASGTEQKPPVVEAPASPATALSDYHQLDDGVNRGGLANAGQGNGVGYGTGGYPYQVAATTVTGPDGRPAELPGWQPGVQQQGQQ